MADRRSGTEARESGTLALVGDVLQYDLEDRPAWRLPVTDIRLVGEYTTSGGPFVDDYFLVFVGPGADVYEASFYAQGRDNALADLSTQLDAPLQLGLANSTSWRSKVLWPPELAAQPLFEMQRRPPRLLREHVWTWLGVPPDNTTLTAHILKHLQRHSSQAK